VARVSCFPRLRVLLLLAALPLAACLTRVPDKVGYEIDGAHVRWVGVSLGSVLAEVDRFHVREADIATFRILADEYAVDAHRVYHRGRVIAAAANPATFKTTGGRFAVDSLHAYYEGKLLEGARGAAWRRIEGGFYSTDGVSAWYMQEPLPGVDGATFRTGSETRKFRFHSANAVARDARNFYRYNAPIGSVDDCGRDVSGGGTYYWGQEELDYLCNELPAASPQE
jgi:hypothetical protein